ncbi:glycosyltransferase family 39 protein [Acetobacter sacchari]|uniref:Glycosyltransferase family 39 protein n=1 Tax=Acetobacter sacchari TaxID=2661687 RepID=A0ABS3M0E4_9PROT|nr:glycosyltransferase family 39 protein [Acetobacter sacchari]
MTQAPAAASGIVRRDDRWIVYGLPVLVLITRLIVNPHYGFFRDELYFIVCGRRIAAGYVDQPVLVPFLAAASQAFGVSLVALRAIPAVFAAVTVWAAIVLSGEMGAGRWGQAMAAASVALAPVLSAFGTTLSPDTVQMALWTLATLLVSRALAGRPRYWLAAGVTFGVAMEAKDSALFMALAAPAALILAGRGRALASRWFLGGVALAILIALPNALWQWRHDWPMLELLRNGRAAKNVLLTPLAFIGQQVQQANPVAAPILVAGLCWCLLNREQRWIGIAYLLLLATMIALHGKAYYLAPIDATMFAAGGVAFECALRRHVALRAAVLACVLVSGFVLLPLTAPVLSEARLLAYRGWLQAHGVHFSEAERGRAAPLGAEYADMHGWRELAGQIADIRRTIPSVPVTAAVFASDYGLASAILVLSPDGFVPDVISGHNAYWIWGPGEASLDAIIDVGGMLAARGECGSVEVLGRLHGRYALPAYDGAPILLCRDMKASWVKLWPLLKRFW